MAEDGEIVQPYMYEPFADDSDEENDNVESDDDVDRLTNTNW